MHIGAVQIEYYSVDLMQAHFIGSYLNYSVYINVSESFLPQCTSEDRENDKNVREIHQSLANITSVQIRVKLIITLQKRYKIFS